MSNLYETDFYAWTQTQAKLLQLGDFSKLDLPNLIEEIASLGKQQRQELRNRLSILLGDLLKWHYQPEKRSRSWLAIIRIQRLDLSDLLTENLSLKSYLEEAIEKAYRRGVQLAICETNLPFSTFPPACLYSLEEILRDRFYPGQPSLELESEI